MKLKEFAAAAVIILVWAAFQSAPGGEGASDFFELREKLVSTYGDAPVQELSQLYRRSTREYRQFEQEHFRFRRAVFAELAGLRDAEERLLVGMLEEYGGDARFFKFCVEALRSFGTLDSHAGEIAAAVGRLGEADRSEIARLITSLYAWGALPAEFKGIVPGKPTAEMTVREILFFSRALASWGQRESVRKELLEKALDGATGFDARVELVRALRDIGAWQEARTAAKAAFEKYAVPREKIEVSRALFSTRQSLVSRFGDIATVSSSWDALYESAVSACEGGGYPAALEEAAIFDAADMAVEKAEAFARLRARAPVTEADLLYAGGLTKAGDHYSARKILFSAISRDPVGGEDAYFDLADNLMALRDAQTFVALARLYSLAFPQPQTARMLSDWLRALGEYETADLLFGAFLERSGLIGDTWFDWQGNRLLAVHYFDTGRLDEGRVAARRSLSEMVAKSHLRSNTRSPLPKQYVGLFARFGAVGELLEYSRAEQAEFPESALLWRIEAAALLHLGRADEAVETSDRMHDGKDVVSKLLFRAEANARAGRFSEAAGLYREAIEADRNVPAVAYSELAKAYAETGKWSEAEDILTRGRAARGAVDWLGLAAFFEHYGEDARAARAYARLADRSLDVGPKQLAAAVRFWLRTGDVDRAVQAIGGRVRLKADLASKEGFLTECAPSSAGEVRAYLELGWRLAAGSLAGDKRLLGLFHRGVGRRAERFLDPVSALEAYREAVALEPDEPESAALLADVAAGWRFDEAVQAYRRVSGNVAKADVKIALAGALFDGEASDEASVLLEEILEESLDAEDMGHLVALFERHRAGRDLAEAAARRSRGFCPWVLRGRLAEAGAAYGDKEAALKEIEETVLGGSYVGRAIWGAKAYLEAGAKEEAKRVLREYKARMGGHPAISIAEADAALERGERQEALEAVAAAQKAFKEEPFAGLFRMEWARLGLARETIGEVEEPDEDN